MASAALRSLAPGVAAPTTVAMKKRGATATTRGASTASSTLAVSPAPTRYAVAPTATPNAAYSFHRSLVTQAW